MRFLGAGWREEGEFSPPKCSPRHPEESWCPSGALYLLSAVTIVDKVLERFFNFVAVVRMIPLLFFLYLERETYSPNLGQIRRVQLIQAVIYPLNRRLDGRAHEKEQAVGGREEAQLHG